MSLDTQQLAWLVLQTVNRTQAKGTTIRLVVPRDPEVARQLDPTLVEHELLAAEAYLLEQGYLAPTNLDLTWGTYTITPAGLEWLKERLPDKEAAFDSAHRAEEVEQERRRLADVEEPSPQEPSSGVGPQAAALEGSQELSEAAQTPATAPEARSRMTEFFWLLRELSGPASVGMLIAASAYMVHGFFPILATEYAGLSAAQAGLIYSLSAAVFLVAGPLFGWITDRYGRLIGIALRSAANIGSSLMYVASPTFVGIAAARSVDDTGKAAFRPAWASAITDIAAKDPPRKGRRLGTLDAVQEIGEIAGPALAGILWQTGGVFALFGVRIAIAIVAEISAITVFGELQNYRPRLRILTWVRKNRRRGSV